jgi:arginyl-tRNA synthetase
MKQKLRDLIYSAAKNAHEKGDLPSADIPAVEVEEPRADAHGDFSSNIAMVSPR